MFDIGFSELLVIAVVALIVIGPERLPTVARTVGHLLGRLQRYVNDVKADINQEIELDELRKMRDSFQNAASEVQATVRREVSKHEQELNEAVGAAVPTEADTAPEPATPPVFKDPPKGEPAAVPAEASRESEGKRESAEGVVKEAAIENPSKQAELGAEPNAAERSASTETEPRAAPSPDVGALPDDAAPQTAEDVKTASAESH